MKTRGATWRNSSSETDKSFFWILKKRIMKFPYAGYLLTMPGLILVIEFKLIPLINGFLLSMQNTRGFEDPKFIGLGNYSRMLEDPVVQKNFSSCANSRMYVTNLDFTATNFGIADIPRVTWMADLQEPTSAET